MSEIATDTLTHWRIEWDDGDTTETAMAAGVTLADAHAHYVGQTFTDENPATGEESHRRGLRVTRLGRPDLWPYLIHYGDRAALIEVPRGATSDDYGIAQKRFPAESGPVEDHWPWADMVRIHAEHWIGRVLYDWGLSGPDGAYFILYQFPGTSDDEVAAAKAAIRRDHDVTSLRVVRFRKMVPFTWQ